jgi:hypothetical protein
VRSVRELRRDPVRSNRRCNTQTTKSKAYGAEIRALPDVSILDLFWLILKFLVALGMVGLLVGAVYFICRLIWKMMQSLSRRYYRASQDCDYRRLGYSAGGDFYASKFLPLRVRK